MQPMNRLNKLDQYTKVGHKSIMMTQQYEKCLNTKAGHKAIAMNHDQSSVMMQHFTRW